MKKIIGILVVMALVVGAIGIVAVLKGRSKPSVVTVGALLIRKDLPTLAKEADTIMIGKVVADLGSGEDASETRLSKVYTDYQINAEKFLKNPQASRDIKVRVAGGKSGDSTVLVEDEAKLTPGERVMLFLSKEKGGRFTVTGFAQGEYELKGGMAKNAQNTSEKDEWRLISEVQAEAAR